MHIRRVPFREGTDADLAALHRVEVPVETERGSRRMPRPLDAYIALARNLPAQYDDHTWLAEEDDGTPVASAACWSDATGDPNLMACDVMVARGHRRRGIGTALLRTICETTIDEGRGLLVWQTFSKVPAGDDFARAAGGRVARVNRTSELRLASVDWSLVDAWATPVHGYELQTVDGALPVDLHEDAAHFHNIMETQPMDDLDVAPRHTTAAEIAELDRSLVASGRRRWTVFVRDAHGRCVGGTEMDFDPDDPALARQQNTGIDPDHRGRGLAKWAKAAVLQRLRTDAPHVERVRTGNAFSNTPMLAINDALGFLVTETVTDWQADPAAVRRALG